MIIASGEHRIHIFQVLLSAQYNQGFPTSHQARQELRVSVINNKLICSRSDHWTLTPSHTSIHLPLFFSQLASPRSLGSFSHCSEVVPSTSTWDMFPLFCSISLWESLLLKHHHSCQGSGKATSELISIADNALSSMPKPLAPKLWCVGGVSHV